jgi:hypothetical protein
MFEKSQEFYRHFNNLVTDYARDEALEAYSDAKDWTKFLKVNLENIIEAYLKEDYQTSNEYLRIDLIGWSSPKWEKDKTWPVNRGYKRAAESDVNLYEYCWDLDIAIEYENDPHDWMDEVIKLCHIKAGLKIVIGYARYDDRGSDKIKLHRTAELIGQLTYGGVSDNEELLIILGNSGIDNAESVERDIDFRPYVFSAGEFIDLPIAK